jgi:hypothetical protein
MPEPCPWAATKPHLYAIVHHLCKENAMENYLIELEIFQGNGGQSKVDGSYPDFVKEGICPWMYDRLRVGQRFRYPDDIGDLCPCLMDSMMGMVRALENGGELPWKYKDKPFEKVIDSEGVTTEFVRRPIPTESGIVIKIIRTVVKE